MIPRTLWTYWYGDREPSWLRQQTRETFIRLHGNPSEGWKVWGLTEAPGQGMRGFGPLLPVWWPDLPDDLPADTRCDVIRWCVLAAEGGVFADLDILFLRPLEIEAFEGFAVTCDGGTLAGDGRAFAIGLVAAPPGDPIVVELAERAQERVWSGAWRKDHQICGSRLLADELTEVEELVGRRAENIPAASLYPQGFLRAQNNLIWMKTAQSMFDFGPLLGLHWGGGHKRSKEEEVAATDDWARSSATFVARCWRRVMLRTR